MEAVTVDDIPIPVERAFRSLAVWFFHNAKNFVFLGGCFYGVMVWSIQPRFEAYATEFVLRTVDEKIDQLEAGQEALESTLGEVQTKQDRVIENQEIFVKTQKALADQIKSVAEQIENQQKLQKDRDTDILRLLNSGAGKIDNPANE